MKAGEKIKFKNGREITVTEGLEAFVVGYSKTEEEARKDLLDGFHYAFGYLDLSEDESVEKLFSLINKNSEEKILNRIDKYAEIRMRAGCGLSCGLDW